MGESLRPQDAEAQLLDASATLRERSVWQQWRNKGAMHLSPSLYPRLSGSGEGDRDRRRIILPLDKNAGRSRLSTSRSWSPKAAWTAPHSAEPPKK